MNDLLRQRIERAGQSSVLRFWNELTLSDQTKFESQLNCVDWSVVAARHQQCLEGAGHPKPRIGQIEPPRHVIRQPQTVDRSPEWQSAAEVGRRKLDRGEVGVLLVAGGSGSRLGFDHPKGMFPIGPITDRSLFQLFAEQVLALTRRHQTAIPFLIMTGEATHDETHEWFRKHDWFGLDANDVFLFQQGWEPAADALTGELLLSGKPSLATCPDGHGGVLQALVRANLFQELKRRRIQTLFYHQVDNPLVHICDPAFLGFHERHGAQVSTKVVCKSSPEEKVGVVVEIDGHSQIIEYIDLPQTHAIVKDTDGQLRFRAGNTGIHTFQCDFLEQVATRGGGLPWHTVRRHVSFVDSHGQVIHPDRPNGLKYERFIFDVLPIAKMGLVVETDRTTEFAPLKNATGDCSATEVRQAMTFVAKNRLRASGVCVPDGVAVEISPLAGLADETLVIRRGVSLPFGESWVLGPENFEPRSTCRPANEITLRDDSNDSIGPLGFETCVMPRVWGGRALHEILGHVLPTDEPYGEAWDISGQPQQISRVADGPLRGTTITELWSDYGHRLHGLESGAPAEFPLLIKWLECRDQLSLQVHPDDAMDRRVLNQPYGKSEAWIVLKADPTARILAGLRPGTSRDDFRSHLKAGTLQECIHSFTPQAGDCIALPAGTIHAAGGGLLIAEVQQSSDATFRLHDWNRLGLDGRPRPLQIDLALEAIAWDQGPVKPVEPLVSTVDELGTTKEVLTELHAFSLTRYSISHPWRVSSAGEMTLWMVLAGNASLFHARSGCRREVKMGRTILLPASVGEVVWSPLAKGEIVKLLCVQLPKSS